MKFYYYLLLVSVLLLCANCNEINPKGEDEVRDFVYAWNNLHTPLKAANLKYEYLDVVEYFGAELTKEQIQLDKQQLFATYPDLSLSIDTNSLQIEKEGKDYLVSFVRKATLNGERATFPTFLSVLHKNSEFKILREGLQQDTVSTTKLQQLFPTKESLNATYNKAPRLYGDFNGDGISEYAFVKLPTINAPATKTTDAICEGGCVSSILFSNPDIAPITVKDAYNYTIENVKDLNGDFADEVGFFSITPTSKTLYIFDATTGSLLTEPVMINTAVHKNLKLIDILKKTGPKKITVTESIQDNGRWFLKSRVVGLE
ncbi:hypothetical protein ACFQO1_11425 [Jejudonia soesokkakensis]|uniref:Lipoprotein n=1 Tax=Jejudonia soesokkakensis TaxID=1323432 RepID=A0ABW2MWZ8_9FLAO